MKAEQFNKLLELRIKHLRETLIQIVHMRVYPTIDINYLIFLDNIVYNIVVNSEK